MFPPWDLHQVCKVPATEEPALAVEVEEVFQSVSAGGAAETVWMPTPATAKISRKFENVRRPLCKISLYLFSMFCTLKMNFGRL